MSNKIEQEMNRIDVPKDLHKRSKMGVSQAKYEMKTRNHKLNGFFLAAASLLVAFGIFTLVQNLNQGTTTSEGPSPIVHEDGSIELPPIQLPDNSESADMIGLIVYKDKIYTQTETKINPDDARALVGEKLGTTKPTIDEWSSQDAYSEEFASTIGEKAVYAVKGYDSDFRLMTYEEVDGQVYTEFYECLNGITVRNGEDIFGKLKMAGNIASAQYRLYSDWNHSVENYHSITDMDLINNFIQSLYEAKPLLRSQQSDPIGDLRSDEEFRELTIQLKDGSKISLTLLKGGYIYYGYMSVYFEMEENKFLELWNQIK